MKKLSFLSLEDLATVAVRTGREFAKDWSDYPKLINAAESKPMTLKSIERLIVGDVFNELDEASLDDVEQLMTEWFNTIRFQYRELVIDSQRGEMTFIEDEQTKDVCSLITNYLTFRTARQAVIDRVTADREVERLQRPK